MQNSGSAFPSLPPRVISAAVVKKPRRAESNADSALESRGGETHEAMRERVWIAHAPGHKQFDPWRATRNLEESDIGPGKQAHRFWNDGVPEPGGGESRYRLHLNGFLSIVG